VTTVEIPLSRGMVARVSPEDAERLLAHRWHAVAAKHTFYAARRTKEKTIYMHREVLGVVDMGRGVFVDHINHDGLDNTRANLRRCTQTENARNRRDKTLDVPAWAIQPLGLNWNAKISACGLMLNIGTYQTEREARIAYAAAEKAILAMARKGGVK
jgi:hypothetical protein